ncbi:nucleotidyltransferase family protein [Thermosphaera chiliense]|uniref:nucleotidyltransferase family protein n=1 Tax=Thermosphaera chiliense TaxID=3402707 RepID=UPI001D09A426|nr:nucleotidyltransferase family protein [Thermosphaera aggregans]
MTAVVLAGGMGTRFHPYTEVVPKPMIPIGVDEKPVLEYIVRWLSRFGVKKFIFLVNYRWKYIQNYFGDGSRFNVEIKYSIDEPDGYTNTGGSILKAYREGLFTGTAIIWYGDILAPLNVEDLLRYHQDKGGDLTLVVTKKYKVPVGVATLGNDFSIIGMREKPDLDINATIGVGVLETRVLDDELEKDLGLDFDFMGDLVPWLIMRGSKIYGYVYSGDWFDVGSLEKYKKLDNNYLSELFKV